MNHAEWKTEMRTLQIKMGIHLKDPLQEHFLKIRGITTTRADATAPPAATAGYRH